MQHMICSKYKKIYIFGYITYIKGMNIPIAGSLPSHHSINSFSSSTVFRPDLYIPTQCQVIRSSATWSAGIGEVDGKSFFYWSSDLIG